MNSQSNTEAKTAEYLAGYDCGLHGANSTNCNIQHFSTREKTNRWEEGKKAGENKKAGILKKHSKH